MKVIRQTFLVVFFTIVLIAILLFALKNSQSVPVDLIITQIEAVPLWTIMVVSFLIGITLSSLLFVFTIIGLYWNYRSALKEINKLRVSHETAGTSSALSSDQRR